MARKFVLLDTSAILGYYVSEAATGVKSYERVKILVESVRHHRADVHILIPSIAIAEVFCELTRLCYSSWDPKTSKKFGGRGKTLDTRRYKTARKNFRRDIHNGALFYQHDLSRYHVLALDLIAPIDKYRKFYRTARTVSMGASDLLIGGMALHLTRLLGNENFALITNDRRMKAIFSKSPRAMKRTTAKTLGLIAAAEELGFGEWSGELYPNVLDLERSNERDLVQFFGSWPLPVTKLRNRKPKA